MLRYTHKFPPINSKVTSQFNNSEAKYELVLQTNTTRHHIMTTTHAQHGHGHGTTTIGACDGGGGKCARAGTVQRRISHAGGGLYHPLVYAERCAQLLEVLDQLPGRVVDEARRRRRAAGTTLVDEDCCARRRMIEHTARQTIFSVRGLQRARDCGSRSGHALMR